MPTDQPTNSTSEPDPLTIGELISLAEAGRLTGFHPTLFRKMALKGRLKAKKIGRDWFTTLAAIEEYKSNRSFKNIPKKYRERP